MWFSESVGHALGAWLGAGAGLSGGVVGGLAGWFAPRGKFKPLLLCLLVLLITAGALLMGVGLYALVAGQPFHVWYPFALIGFILTGVYVPIWFLVQHTYRTAELGRMFLKDLA